MIKTYEIILACAAEEKASGKLKELIRKLIGKHKGTIRFIENWEGAKSRRKSSGTGDGRSYILAGFSAEQENTRKMNRDLVRIINKGSIPLLQFMITRKADKENIIEGVA